MPVTICVAYACGFLAGMANSFWMQVPSYLMEASSLPQYGKYPDQSICPGGQFCCPIIISLLVWANMWSLSFLLAAIMLIINVLVLLRRSFSTLSVGY